MNLILPMLAIMYATERVHGERQTGLLIGIWEIICALVYLLYFIIPDFNQKWEKIISFLLPSVILSLVLFVEESFIYVVFANLIVNLLFIWHFTIKSKNN